MTDEALRLSDDLQRSRERLVEAREEGAPASQAGPARRLGPSSPARRSLSTPSGKLMRRDPDAAEELLLEPEGGLPRMPVTDIRRLGLRLRPPALDDLGLLGA
jgi:hypothetical protein